MEPTADEINAQQLAHFEDEGDRAADFGSPTLEGTVAF